MTALTLAPAPSPEPTRAEWRAAVLLAQSVISHRQTADGLTAQDVAVVQDVLRGTLEPAVR